MTLDLDALIERLRSGPQHCVVLSDFDGTLAPIVASPPTARPLPAAVHALERLAARCRVVGVISGRPLDFLDPFVPSAVRIAGLYGIESRVDGVRRTHPDAAPWRPVLATVAARAGRELAAALAAGATIEVKGLSLTLHTRNVATAVAADVDAAVERFARSVSTSTGLELRSAKRSVELHPPLPVDKGTVVRDWAKGAEVAVFLGDDVGDLPAYGALAELAASGVATCAIVVGGAELPAELAGAADVMLGSPRAAADVLGQLAAAAAS